MTKDRLEQIFDNKASCYDDISYAKRLIRDRLINDKDVIEILNNPDLDVSVPEDYYNTNIFSYLIVPDSEDRVKNYICFEVDDIGEYGNSEIKTEKIVTFLAVSHQEDINTKWGVNRHDLLGYLIKDLFNWSNLLGIHLVKFYDVAEVSEKDYNYRVLKFRTVTTNILRDGMAGNHRG